MKNLYLLSIITILLLSCNKEGPEGPAGTNGQDGNANVQLTTFAITSWTESGVSYKAASPWLSDITQNIVDNGAVHTYMSNGSGGWEPLPLTLYPSSTYSRTYTAVHYLNGVTLWVNDSDLNLPSDPGTRSFKVVAVAASAKIANPDVDYTNYEEVKQTFNLLD